MIKTVKKDLTTWQSLIEMTAGKLNTSKCAHYILQWKFNKNGIPTMCNKIDDEIIMSTNDNSTNEILTRLRNNKAYKYVGITTSPNGNTDESIKALQKICNEFAYNIQTSSIQPHEE